MHTTRDTILGILVVVGTIVGVLSATSARADTCSVNGTSYVCDFICTSTCNVPSNCATGLGDGQSPCVVCGTANADTIYFGAQYDTVTCGKGGNDVIYATFNLKNIASGGPGNDTIYGNNGDDVFYGDDGDDQVYAGEGNNEVYGGAGNDIITTGSGDDFVSGGSGNDQIMTCGGRNVVRGDGGADVIDSNSLGSNACLVTDDVVGSLYCGGDGDDTIRAVGPGHQCIDAGADQTNSDGDDCTYTYEAWTPTIPGNRTATALDLGTARGCAQTSGMSSTGERCGCD